MHTGPQAPFPRLTDLWEQDNGQALDEQQKHQFDDMQQQILDETTSEQTRQALAGFGLNADELRQKLLPPATPITHIHLYHCDHLGTPQALIDTLGQVDWQIELDPWGNTRKEYNRLKLHQPIRMQGQHLDEASGLFYNRYRYYDPGLGRYLARDPIGLMGGLNQYIYSGNPNFWIDPLGLQKISSAKSRSGLSQAALFDELVPQKILDKETLGMIQLPNYDASGLIAGKKPWQSAAQHLSPYEYTQYCKKWSKENLTCTARYREPGRDVKVTNDYMPSNLSWRTDQLPQGYSCDIPYYFMDLQGAGSAASADFSDVVDIMGKALQQRRGGRK